jgi:hypothetical protein
MKDWSYFFTSAPDGSDELASRPSRFTRGKNTCTLSIETGWALEPVSTLWWKVLHLCEGGSTETRPEGTSREYCAMQSHDSIISAELGVGQSLASVSRTVARSDVWRRLQSDAQVKQTVRDFLQHPSEFFEKGIQRLVTQWDTCLNVGGDFVLVSSTDI